MKKFDVIVVGGGHAGCEAATAASRLGANVCLITFDLENLGEMSCNPSIGGIAKGNIVQEVDAMGGMMGVAADHSGIHFKILNHSKGPAVWGLRAQIDRALYKSFVRQYIESDNNISIIIAEVYDILLDSNFNKIIGVKSSKGDICARSIILTTGTFLNSIMRVGKSQKIGGRFGEKSSTDLAQAIKKLDIQLGRLKTGTPPRLLASSINWSILEEQKSDEVSYFFSQLTKKIQQKQVSCFITNTTRESHDIIVNNAHLSPLLSGEVISSGPRYCPSIEDKIKKFSNKDSHQIFLEPEGLNSDLIYPNGISTSMPKEVQLSFLKTIRGLENVVLVRNGYLVEYDFIDPKGLKPTLELKKIAGLFVAGQIIGTTGYEEAAGLGMIAGINAVFSQENKQFILNRAESYIGVMIDDLTKYGTSEPYRMMTSRAEHRIFLRPDNVDLRLTKKAIEIGLIDNERIDIFIRNKKALEELREIAHKIKISHKIAKEIVPNQPQNNNRMKSLYELLAVTKIDIVKLKTIISQINHFDDKILEKLRIESIYNNYIKRHGQDIKELLSDAKDIIPENIDFEKILALSNEMKEKLKKIKPKTIGDLRNIQGLTPTTIIAIKLFLRKIKNDAKQN